MAQEPEEQTTAGAEVGLSSREAANSSDLLGQLPKEVDWVACMVRGEKDTAEALDYYYTADQMRAYAREQIAKALSADRESRGIFIARIENMQRNGDRWLTTESVLALLNDCDMLAARA